ESAKLLPVMHGLLEVVAEDFVQFHDVDLTLFEPVREALVQVSASEFREPVVGGISNQDVAKAEAILAGKLRSIKAEQAMTHEGCRPWRDLALLDGQSLNGAAVEDLSFDRAAFENPSLGGVQLVEAGRNHGA